MLILRGENLGDLLDAVAAQRGIRTGTALATAITNAGHKTSQSTCSDFLSGKRTPTPGWMVGYIKALDVKGEQRRELLRLWFAENPTLRELYAMGDSPHHKVCDT